MIYRFDHPNGIFWAEYQKLSNNEIYMRGVTEFGEQLDWCKTSFANIEHVVKNRIAYGYYLPGIKNKDYATLKKEAELKSCNHEWKQYLGLSESFQYCTKCDKKS